MGEILNQTSSSWNSVREDGAGARPKDLASLWSWCALRAGEFYVTAKAVTHKDWNAGGFLLRQMERGEKRRFQIENLKFKINPREIPPLRRAPPACAVGKEERAAPVAMTDVGGEAKSQA
jgi:hypothetical protein